MYSKTIIMVLPCLLITGCGSGSDSASGFVKTSNTTPLEGTWQSGCRSIGENRSNIEHYIFDTNAFTYSFSASNNTSCQFPEVTMVVSGGFELSEEIILSSGETVTQFDGEILTIKAAFYNSDAVRNFNLQSACNVSNWQVGKLQEVTDCNIFKDINKGLEALENDIVAIDNDVLRVGLHEEFNSGNYPTRLKNTLYFKQ